MKSKNEIAKEIRACENMIRNADEMHAHLRPAPTATKFKVSINIEVVNVGGIPADVLPVRRAIRDAITRISSGDVVCVNDIYVEEIS